jgi:hypothetical protein
VVERFMVSLSLSAFLALREQKGRLHYSMQDGRLFVDWQIDPEEDGIGHENDKSEQGP